jgi:hypothetical protein
LRGRVFDHLVVVLLDQVPANRARYRRLERGVGVGVAQDMYDEVGSDGRRARTVQQIADEFGVTRSRDLSPPAPRRGLIGMSELLVAWCRVP